MHGGAALQNPHDNYYMIWSIAMPPNPWSLAPLLLIHIKPQEAMLLNLKNPELESPFALPT